MQYVLLLKFPEALGLSALCKEVSDALLLFLLGTSVLAFLPGPFPSYASGLCLDSLLFLLLAIALVFRSSLLRYPILMTAVGAAVVARFDFVAVDLERLMAARALNVVGFLAEEAAHPHRIPPLVNMVPGPFCQPGKSIATIPGLVKT